MTLNFLFNKKLVLTVLIKTTLLISYNSNILIEAIDCNNNQFVYGSNEIIDQLMVCSLSKSYDLDLTPKGEYIKSTSKALVDQGLSNKTTILHAKLNGLWSGKRTKFIDSAWKCETNETILSSIIEFNGLSLEVIEKVEIPLHKNQHKLSIHKPCKTFDLPVWMCRTTKPIYRTTKTWVNSVYLNLTLTQSKKGSFDNNKPIIEKVSTLFTCPETFKQKITHSPSAMYILAKYIHQLTPTDQHQTTNNNSKSNQTRKRNLRHVSKFNDLNIATKLSADITTQDGKGPTLPPYHNSVNLIMNHLIDSITKSINECIEKLDIDLNLMNDYSSFKTNKLNEYYDNEQTSGEVNLSNLKCSNKYYISQKIDLANQASSPLTDNNNNSTQQHAQAQDSSHLKRSQYMIKYPEDPNQLLNPYGYYHDNADRMIDDN